MKKIVTLLLVLTAFAMAARPGLGTLIGAGVGAGVGKYTESKIEEALNRESYEGDGFTLTKYGIYLKDLDTNLYVKTISEQNDLDYIVKSANKILVTGKSDWGVLVGDAIACESTGTSCVHINYDIKNNVIYNVKLSFKQNPENEDDWYGLIQYESVEPGWFDYVKSFLMNNIIFVAIILFSIIGFIIDQFRKRKAA